MALQKNVQYTPKGFDDPAVLRSAYIRVSSISGNKEAACITVDFYNNKNNQMKMAQTKAYQFQPSVDSDSKNFIAQAYEHLKTLPDFAGATDC
jgi:hypothetical protein